MSKRPIALPGIAAGIVLLASMTGFAKLPKEAGADAEAAAAAANMSEYEQIQISACRTWETTVTAGGLEQQLAALDAEAEAGEITAATQESATAAIGQNLSMLAQISTHPQVNKSVIDALNEVGSGLSGIQAGIADADKVAAALSTVDAGSTAFTAACGEVDPA